MAFSANKTGLHDIPEIVMKVVLNTINQTYKSGVDCDLGQWQQSTLD
jgi:hypothetical protein